MPAVMQDGDFDSLVDTLHALTLAMQERGEIDRWQIRVALGEHGVLPLRATSEDGLPALLNAIRWPVSEAVRPAA